uniref:Uncharacterized protein n=1 Tax=Oryza sativa subsp. japonica TaxID=39947 RepID=Q9FW82_ORYSJ|nr:hypothetical protein [Oryza sativa Japonica Group]
MAPLQLLLPNRYDVALSLSGNAIPRRYLSHPHGRTDGVTHRVPREQQTKEERTYVRTETGVWSVVNWSRS